jgi:hypothetical protein
MPLTNEYYFNYLKNFSQTTNQNLVTIICILSNHNVPRDILCWVLGFALRVMHLPDRHSTLSHIYLLHTGITGVSLCSQPDIEFL